MLSSKSSVQITTIKGFGSGTGSLLVAFLAGEKLPQPHQIPVVMLLGFVAYGLSINFYIKAQKHLGAAKTSAYYSIAPFLGVIFGMVMLGERPAGAFWLGLAGMIAATVLLVMDTVSLQHSHPHSHIHCHEHRHGDMTPSHEHEHIHIHIHTHGREENIHSHTHDQIHGHNHLHP